MFEVTKRKAGKAQILRVSQEVWDKEADLACFAAELFESMRTARDGDNLEIFSQQQVMTLMTNYIEGCFGENQYFITCTVFFCLSDVG